MNDMSKRRIVKAADALANIVPENEVQDMQQRMIAAGIRLEAYRDRETQLPMTILGQLFGAMVDGGATPEQAKRWLVEGYGYPGCPELRMTGDAIQQLCRLLNSARAEFERLCRPGTVAVALAALGDGLIPFFERVLAALPA